MALDRNLAAAIAVTRFGLGAKPGEILVARDDPEAWLLAQMRPGVGANQPQPGAASSAERVTQFREYQKQRQAAKAAGENFDPVKFARKLILDDAGVDFIARVRLAATTDADFRERWALFWCNHFTVSATKAQVATLVGPFEREAIRPFVFGRFEDLLVASTAHPGMLVYLDQAKRLEFMKRWQQAIKR